MWNDLAGEIAVEFERLDGCFDFRGGSGDDMSATKTLAAGFGIDERLNLMRLTRGIRDMDPTPQREADRANKRRALEANRREYKARKSREYYAARKSSLGIRQQ